MRRRRECRVGVARAALLLAFAAAVALSALAATGSLLPGELRLARAWQDTPAGAAIEPLADWLALSAVEYTVVFVAMFVAAARRDWSLAATALLAIAATALNAEIKDLIGRARPTPAQLEIRAPAPGLGFPSGHAMTATLLYGYAAVVACARLPRSAALLAAPACVVAAALIGWDRVYDGAHWPSDVVGGYAIGAVLLELTVAAPRALAAMRRRNPTPAPP